MEWQALDATLALEYVAWAAVAVVKFVVTPSLMMATGHPWWGAWAVTAAGAAGGVWVVWHSGKRLFSWFEEKLGSREGRGKRTFTPGRRRIVWLKNNFGLHGLLAVSGLISVPIATTLAAKYFRHHPWVMQLLMLAFALWALALAALSWLVKNMDTRLYQYLVYQKSKLIILIIQLN